MKKPYQIPEKLVAKDYALALRDVDPETALVVASDAGVQPPKKNSALRLQALTLMVVRNQTSCNQSGTQVLTVTVALTHTSLRPELRIRAAERAAPSAATETTAVAAVTITEAATQATTGRRRARSFISKATLRKATERVPQ